MIRTIYGKDDMRLLRCRSCREECSERRNTALFHTNVRESTAQDVIAHRDEGCSVRSTARLTQVAQATGARLLKTSGRHAQRLHDHQVHDLTPRALQFDEQWSFVVRRIGLVEERG